MAKILRRLRGWLARRKFDARDLLAIAGVGAIANGLLLIHPTLAWLAIGIFLLAAATAPSERR